MKYEILFYIPRVMFPKYAYVAIHSKQKCHGYYDELWLKFSYCSVNLWVCNITTLDELYISNVILVVSKIWLH